MVRYNKFISSSDMDVSMFDTMLNVVHLVFFLDVSGFQVRTHLKASTQSQTCHDAVVCSKAAKDADQILGETVEKK